MKLRWLLRLGLLAGVGVLSTGCAEEREPINRVESMALEKKFFVGENIADPSDDPEFYSQAFIIDVPFGSSGDALWTVGFGSKLTRVRFEISENYLIARITYERIDDSDTTGLDPADRNGVIAGLWRIKSHFDIRRGYNPQTGEHLNIIEENESDRPWYEREYMRVDWSTNLNTESYDFNTLTEMGMISGITYQPIAYEVNDPGHPHAPRFSAEDGYFDVVNKAFAQPQMIDLSRLGWGIDKYPACLLEADVLNGNGPVGSCNPVEITVRQSFLKIRDTDYEPADWDGRKFAAYGAFTSDRLGYARDYGLRDEKWRRYINRFNIWETSHFFIDPDNRKGHIACGTPEKTGFGGDVHEDADKNGTEDQCEEVTELLASHPIYGKMCEELGNCGGSRCDEYTRKCTLPYRFRTPKPMAWYLTVPVNTEARYDENGIPDIYKPGTNEIDEQKYKRFLGDLGAQMAERYYEPTEWATVEWDVALRQAVQAARYAECVQVGQPDCAARYPVVTGQQQDNQDMVQLVRQVDACTKEKGKSENSEKECRESVADRVWEAGRYSGGVLRTTLDEPPPMRQADAVSREQPSFGIPKMIHLCHSPVRGGDGPMCGKPGTVARMGDTRYHQVNVIPQPNEPSPWGIMVSSIDPKTGEEVMLSANIFGHVTDFWAQRLVDYTRYIKGELSTEDVTNAKYVSDWIGAERLTRFRGGLMPQFTQNDITERLASAAGISVERMKAARANVHNFKKSEVYRQLRDVEAEARDVRASAAVVGSQRAVTAARLRAAAGTEFEAKLITKPVLQRVGFGSLGAVDGMVEYVSPLRMNNPQHELEYKRLKEKALASRHMCIIDAESAAPEGTSLSALADRLFDIKFSMGVLDQDEAFNQLRPHEKTAERTRRIRNYLARRAHYNVITHEIGHGIGLRHNFVGSSDALIFRPQYWQLRTKDGTVTETCKGLTTDGENCIGPRYFDPMTAHEDSQLLNMFAHGSIMDYPGNAEADLVGLGVYDFAAARMFYGGTVAVYNQDDTKVGTPIGRGLLGKVDNFGGILGIRFEVGDDSGGSLKSIHYSELNKGYKLLNNCHDVNEGDYRPETWDDWGPDGVWDPVLDGFMVKGKGGSYTRCKEREVDHVFWSQLRMPTTDERRAAEAKYYRGGPSIDPKGRIRVPYGFATDSWADLGNLSVYRHDMGADPYELFQFFISQQELGHIWTAYRRGRQTFSVRRASSGVYSRYNAKMRDGAKGFSLYASILRNAAPANNLDHDSYLGFYFELFKDNILASSMAFDHFTRQFQRPHVGMHFAGNKTAVLNPLGGNLWVSEDDPVGDPRTDFPRIVIPNGTGTSRYSNRPGDVTLGGQMVSNSLADDQGEYDRDYTLNAGSYYQKIFVPILLSESEDNFISDSRNDFVDPRYRAVSLADLFPDGYRRFMANMLTNDEYIRAVRLTADRNLQPLVSDNTVVDPWNSTIAGGYIKDPIVWTSWWPKDGPVSCIPSNGTWACMSPTPMDGEINPNPARPDGFALLDPQIGWEQKKHLIAQTLLYIPENEQQWWLEQMRVYDLSIDTDPKFPREVRFVSPLSGKTYVAKSYGREKIFGQEVEKGIAARVLEYANQLVAASFHVYNDQVDAYQSDDPTKPTYLPPSILDAMPKDQDGDGKRDWPMAVLDKNGRAAVIPTVRTLGPGGTFGPYVPDCNPLSNPNCEAAKCTANPRCTELEQYVETLFYLRQAFAAYRLANTGPRGIF